MTDAQVRLLIEIATAIQRIPGTDPKDFIGQHGTEFGRALRAVEEEWKRYGD